MDELSGSTFATPAGEEHFSADDADAFDDARAQLAERVHEINTTIQLVDTLLDKASAAPASASLERANIELKGTCEVAHDVAYAGLKLYKFNKAPDGSVADVTQYASVTASVRQHVRLLLAQTMAVRSFVP